MGISRTLFKKIPKSFYTDDTYFFDLKTSQLYSSAKITDKILFFNGKNLQKAANLHRGYFNSEVSRFYEILKLDGNIRFRGNTHTMIENKAAVREISNIDTFLKDYFGLFKDMFNDRFIKFFKENSFRVKYLGIII